MSVINFETNGTPYRLLAITLNTLTEVSVAMVVNIKGTSLRKHV